MISKLFIVASVLLTILIFKYFIPSEIDVKSINISELPLLSSLSECNSNGKLCLSIKGVVFDVSKGKGYYGPGGSYEALCGKDASRAFATGCLKVLTADLRNLSDRELKDLDSWFDFYVKKYEPIGRVILPEYSGPLPEGC